LAQSVCVVWGQQQQQQQQQQHLATDEERRSCCCSLTDADALRSPAGALPYDERSPEIQRLHDELVACKLREAEAHLSMKEFEQKLLQLQRHWQAGIDLFSFSRVYTNQLYRLCASRL